MFKNVKTLKAIDSNEQDSEDYKKMIAVWDACEEAGIDVPEEVLEFLKIEEGESPIITPVEFTPDEIQNYEELITHLKENEGKRRIDEYRISTEGLIKGIQEIIIIPSW